MARTTRSSSAKSRVRIPLSRDNFVGKLAKKTERYHLASPSATRRKMLKANVERLLREGTAKSEYDAYVKTKRRLGVLRQFRSLSPTQRRRASREAAARISQECHVIQADMRWLDRVLGTPANSTRSVCRETLSQGS